MSDQERVTAAIFFLTLSGARRERVCAVLLCLGPATGRTKLGQGLGWLSFVNSDASMSATGRRLPHRKAYSPPTKVEGRKRK